MARFFSASDEKGTTIVEASFILPIVLMFSFFIILLSFHVFSIYSTYYACIQSLKSSSTGPRVVESQGDAKQKVEDILKWEVTDNFNAYKTGVDINEVIVRNQFGCFKLVGGAKVIKDGCVNTEDTLRITPNSWISIEVPVRPINFKIFNIDLPAVNVKSTIRMYDWL